LTKNFQANSITIFCAVRETYDKIVAFFVPKNAHETSYGTGIFKYIGSAWEEDGIFVGYCNAIQSGMVKFSGENANILFENFRSVYLNKEENKTNFDHFTLNAAFSFALPLESPLSKLEIQTLFEKLSKIQTTKIPKVSIDKKGDLYIGGKTSSNCISLSGNFSSKADDFSTTSYVRVEAKFEGPKDFLNLLLLNKEVEFIVVASSLLVKKLSKVKLIGLFEELRNVLISQHNFGNVIQMPEDTSKPTTKVGKTVYRSLVTIQNKLIAPNTSQETQQIVQKWVHSFVREIQADSHFTEFLQQCTAALTGTTTGNPRSRSRVTPTAQVEETEKKEAL
jgi:hypothetical protein